MEDKVYTVQQAYDILLRLGVVNNIEVLRRWLRNGKIEGIRPTTRKEGWRVKQSAIDAFLKQITPSYATDNKETVAKENYEKEIAALKAELTFVRENNIQLLKELNHFAKMRKELAEELKVAREQREKEKAEAQQQYEKDKDHVRAIMWWELVGKNFFQDYVLITQLSHPEMSRHRLK